MTREIKFGLLLVLGLTTVFSVMVYKRMHGPLDLSADTKTEGSSESSDASTPPPLTIDRNMTSPVVTAEGLSEDSSGEPQVIGAAESKPAAKSSRAVVEDDDPFSIPPARPAAPSQAIVVDDDPFDDGGRPQSGKVEAANSAAPATAPQNDPFAPEVIRSAPFPTVRTPAGSAPVRPATLPVDSSDPFGPPLATPKAVPAPRIARPPSQPMPAADDPFTTPELTLPGRKEATASSTTVIERLPATPANLDLGEIGIRNDAGLSAGMPAGTRYVIEPADNYWSISKKVYGTGRYFQALLKHNEAVVPDPQKMRPGMEIAAPPAAELEARYPELIPEQESKTTHVAGLVGTGDTYISETGDNFWTISKKVYGSGRYFQALAEHNKAAVPDPLKLKAGTSIQIPPAAELQQRYAVLLSATDTIGSVVTGSSSGDSDLPGFFVGSDDQPRYRVGADDTLSGIARAHLGRSSRWVQILEMNRDVLKDGNTLSVGTVLRLPHDASQVRAVGFDHSGR